MTEIRRLLNERFLKNYDNNIRALREVEGSTEAKFDARKVLSATERDLANEKWSKYDTTTANQKKIFIAAKNGDPSAINYIWLQCAANVTKTFWKSFLGPNRKAQQGRIQNGAFTDWCSIAFETLTGGFKEYRDAKGALQTFDPSKYKDGNLFQNFRFYFWQLLRNSAKEANIKEHSSGMSDTPGIKDGSFVDKVQIGQYDPVYMDEMQETHGAYDDPTAKSFENSEEVSFFLSKWKEFAQNPKVSSPRSGGVSPAAILKVAIEAGPGADSFKVLTNAFPQVSRNTLANYLQDAVKVMTEYDLTYQQLMTTIHEIGDDKVASYLDGPGTTESQEAVAETTGGVPETKGHAIENAVEKTVGKKAVKDGKNAEFDSRWNSFVNDPHLWTSTRKGWNAGAMAYEIVKDPRTTVEDITEWNGIKGSFNEATVNRVYKMLKKFGVEEVLKMKKADREHYAAMIGDDI
jgi:hypothetical protein